MQTTIYNGNYNLLKKIDFVPKTDIQRGIENFINWYYKENKK